MSLRDELAGRTHPERMQRILEEGNARKQDAGARERLNELAGGDTFARWMAIKSCYASRDGALVLAHLQDPSGRVRAAALKLVPFACDDEQALEAVKLAFETRKHHRVLSSLRKHKRFPPIDAFLDWLRDQPGETLFGDIVPYGSPAAIARHSSKALERAGFVFWDRMIRCAPGPLAGILMGQVSAQAGHPDSRLRWILEKAFPAMVDRAPDEVLPLWGLLRQRGFPVSWTSEMTLVRRRPRETFDTLFSLGLTGPSECFRPVAHELGKERLVQLLRWNLGQVGAPGATLARIPPSEREDVAVIWAEELLAKKMPRPCVDCFPFLDGNPTLREQVYQAWSRAAQDKNGAISLDAVAALPVDLAAREARRHLFQVTQLATRPLVRLLYAEYLPWEEVKAALLVHMGHPEGDVRGPVVATALRAAGRTRTPEVLQEALGMVTARKNEQDPVRALLLKALLTWPREVWKAEHLPVIGQIVRDALDAADLSHGTARLLEDLVLRVFCLDGAWGALWLTTLARERGQIHTSRLGDLLSDEEVCSSATALLELATAWAQRERDGHLMNLCTSLGARIRLVPGLSDLLESILAPAATYSSSVAIMALFSRHEPERFARLLSGVLEAWLADPRHHSRAISLAGATDPMPDALANALIKIAEQASSAGTAEAVLSLLRTHRKELFFREGARLLKLDPSFILVPSLLWLAHRRRQDLLTPYLRGEQVRGRFATGKTSWVLPVVSGFERWSPEQHALYERTLGRVCGDTERDTPTIGWAIYRLQDLCFSDGERLIQLASDERAAIREMAIRALSRLDAGQGIPTLLTCMDDARARIAIYALRRAILSMPPSPAVAILRKIPARKVTVAKEVLRLLGEFRSEEAYQAILHMARGKLHRDVRIALLRALWDHLERDETWQIFETSALGEDWIIASRVGNIPPDRLSDRSERRLSALLARVLERPEPEARIDLLQRAAHLPIRDHERHFYRRCLARMESRYDDEIDAAVSAAVARATEHDVGALVEQIREISLHRKVLQRVLLNLSSGVYLRSSVARSAVRKALEMMAEDALLVELRARVAARVFSPEELLSDLDRVTARGWLDEFPGTAVAPVGELSPQHLEIFERAMASRKHFALRLAGLQALQALSGHVGWTPELRSHLAAYQGDPSPRVAITAQFVFPPLEEPAKPTTPKPSR